MPDQIDGALQAATAEPTAPDITPSAGEPFDPERLGDVVEERINAALAAQQERANQGYRNLQSQLEAQRIEARQQERRIEEILKVVSSNGSVTDEDLQRIDEKLELETHRARAKAAVEKPAVKAEPEGDPQSAADRLVAHQYFRGGWQDQLKDVFEDEGQEWGTEQKPSVLRQKVEALQVKVDARTGQPKWAEWMREAKKLVKAAADDAEKPARAAVPSAANGGGALGSHEAIRKAYANGEIDFSPQVAAALAAL